jgi:fluoride exporter
MKKIVFIGVGGFFGAIFRFYIKNLHLSGGGVFPWNTLLINITGTFVLALILTVAYEVWEFDSAVRLGVATGFLGAYTTFSTMCKEIVGLMGEHYYVSAVSYIILSIGVGLFTGYIGVVIARELISKLVKSGDMDDLDAVE